MSYLFAQSDAAALPLEDNSVDLVFTSPPYCDARTYGIGAQRDCVSWVNWMLTVVKECCRVSRGLVLINCAGVTRDRIYQPAPEGLCWEWFKAGGNLWTPAYWHRVGIPGSGGKHWLRKDVEYVLCFKREHAWPAFSNNTAMGHPPKWGPGGEMSNRLSSGARVNQWGPIGGPGGMTGRRANGDRKPRHRPSHHASTAGKIWGGGGTSFGRRANGDKIAPAGTQATGEQLPNRETAFPVLANPGNLVKTIVGGGVMGHPLCHENEAPFPESLAEFFLRSFCPPGGKVLDCFSGSGTTVDVANRLGMHGIGTDIRLSQCELGRRRLENPTLRKMKVAPVLEAIEHAQGNPW